MRVSGACRQHESNHNSNDKNNNNNNNNNNHNNSGAGLLVQSPEQRLGQDLNR